MNIKEARKNLRGRKTTYEDLATYALMIDDPELIGEINALNTKAVNNLGTALDADNVERLHTDQPFVYYGVAAMALMSKTVDADKAEKLNSDLREYCKFVDDFEENCRSGGYDTGPLEADSAWSHKKFQEELEESEF